MQNYHRVLSVFSKFSPTGPDADRGYRQRSNTETSSSHDIAAFRHWALSICFTALIEQHKEETSIRGRTARRRKTKKQSFCSADLIHKSSWLLSLVIQKGNRNRTNKERCQNASSSLVLVCFDRGKKLYSSPTIKITGCFYCCLGHIN